PRVLAFGDLLDDLRAEGGKVVRGATRDEAVVDDDLLVDPAGARVPQVGLEARVAGDLAVAHDIRLDEDPGAVADDADRLVLLEEAPCESHRRLVHPQMV